MELSRSLFLKKLKDNRNVIDDILNPFFIFKSPFNNLSILAVGSSVIKPLYHDIDLVVINPHLYNQFCFDLYEFLHDKVLGEINIETRTRTREPLIKDYLQYYPFYGRKHLEIHISNLLSLGKHIEWQEKNKKPYVILL